QALAKCLAIFCSAGLCRVTGAVPQIHWGIASFFIFQLGIIPNAPEQPQATWTNQHPINLGARLVS
ncbi:MAG TPA: hypothetical protein VNM37_21185, partial [Candidatus Dormibacteraeota bacterium]|nr:hypothetical protein [Candidatus Dormibacteraeota bacterium]